MPTPSHTWCRAEQTQGKVQDLQDAVAQTLDQGNYKDLHKMVSASLCDNLTAELYARRYWELAALEEMTYSKPALEGIGISVIVI